MVPENKATPKTIILNLQQMKTVKMSLASIKGKLSRQEMKAITAGSGGFDCGGPCGKCLNACVCGAHQSDNCVKQ